MLRRHLCDRFFVIQLFFLSHGLRKTTKTKNCHGKNLVRFYFQIFSFSFWRKTNKTKFSGIVEYFKKKKTIEMEWTREKRKKVEYRKTFLFSFKGCGLRNENAIAVWYVVSFRSKLVSAPISVNRAVKF